MNNQTKLIFFDLDGTLVDGMEYIYQHLWEYFGIDKAKTREVLRQYIAKEVSYSDWVQNDVKLLQDAGATKRGILDAIMTLHPMQGAIATIRALQERRYKIFVLSDGIDLVVEAVYGDEAKDLFEAIFINRFQFDESGKLTGATATEYDMEHKAECIKDMAQKYGVDIKNCVFVGNNENDVQAALTAGTSIAFNSKSEKLVEVVTHHVESKDLFDILKFIN